jgi:D-alanyl-lipoteichoic acid acyltransferase DltB (MBOAT superfamily)
VPDDLLYRLGGFALAVAVASTAAIPFYFALRTGRRARTIALLLASAFLLVTPFLVPPGARFLRLLAAILAATHVLKLYDLHVGAARGVVPCFRAFLAFLPSIFSLVHRKLDGEPRPATRDNLRRVAVGTALFILMTALFIGTFRVDWSRHPFALEHAVKVVTLFLAIVPATSALGAAWNLLGGRGRTFMDNPFAARTPADFWRRYNRPVHQFLHEDVFLPAGGARSPLRGILAVFLVSAAVHEYVFSVAIGKVQGYQTAYFLVQALAVAATMRLKPRGASAAAATAATFAFNVATAVLFFASVDEVLPFFYRNEVPVWE